MHNPFRYIARIDIEFITPFIVGSGERDQESDSTFVADVNGLPAIPGSSLAGVLRSAFASDSDRRSTDNLFGWQLDDDGSGSRLSVSWAVILDSMGIPVEGRLQEKPDDPVLRSALAGTIRDHVRINDRGTADDNGKFDERAVMAGHRFRFELLLEGTEDDRHHWKTLMDLFGGDNLRIGGKSRRGFGAFRTVAIYENIFDLETPSQRDAFLELPVELAHLQGLNKRDERRREETTLKSPALTMDVTLVPDGFWLIGGGDDENENAEKAADINPVFDTKIDWSTVPARETRCAIIPGTAIKGPLAHRTAFYDNAAEGRFSDATDEANRPLVGEANPAVRELFGCAKKKDQGQRGRIMIDDVYLEKTPTEKYLPHVALDRFTCGPIDGALFTEKAFFGGEVPLRLVIDDYEKISPRSLNAFRRAVEDLCSGRLAIGAGSGRGNGYCSAKEPPKWSDASWAEGGKE